MSEEQKEKSYAVSKPTNLTKLSRQIFRPEGRWVWCIPQPRQARREMATLPTCPQGALQRTRAGSKPGLQVPRPPLLAVPSAAENSEELCRSSRWRPGHAVREEMFAKANHISH